MTLEPDEDAERIVADCLLLPGHEQQECIDRACREHPELEATLRARVDVLRRIGAFGVISQTAEAFPERLGDFRLLERLGEGGMGVVFRARQESLGRDVALKVVRPEWTFFEKARERFRREAETVASLNHPGIVPIHVVGEEGGVPYIAMEWIQGPTLDRVLKHLRGRSPESLSNADLEDLGIDVDDVQAWVPWCVKLVAQIASALQFAHERSVLHRDVKPSNVALSPDGRAHLLDFGLVATLGGERITRSGSTVGTPAYMSPEQLRGRTAPDARSDVYATGVTLYELLALQSPFAAKDEEELRERVFQGRVDPLRARNRRVSADLETVVAKAMDVEPARRYATMGAFQDDLERVLAKRPIQARPPGALLRARRLAERRPALVTALVLGFVLCVGTPTALYVQQHAHASELGAALERESSERGRAQRAERLATDRLETANRTLELLGEVFDAADPDVARGKPLTAREALLNGVERTRAKLEREPAVAARVFFTAGRVLVNLGAPERAIELLEHSVAYFASEASPGPASLAQALHQLARAQWNAERYAAADATYERAHAAAVGAFGEDSSEAARALAERGQVLLRLGRREDAFELLQRAVRTAERLETDDPNERGSYQAILATAYMQCGEPERAEPIFEAFVEQLRDTPLWNTRQAMTALSNLALVRKQLGRTEEAVALNLEALGIARAILPEGHSMLAISCLNAGTALETTRRNEEAVALYREGIEHAKRSDSGAERAHVLLHGALAANLLAQERFAEAVSTYDAMERLLTGDVIPERDPLRPETAFRHAVALIYAGEGERALAKGREALEGYEALGPEGIAASARVRAVLVQALRRAGFTECADALGQ